MKQWLHTRQDFAQAFQQIGIRRIEYRIIARRGRVFVDGRPLWGHTRALQARLKAAGFAFSPGEVGFYLRMLALRPSAPTAQTEDLPGRPAR